MRIIRENVIRGTLVCKEGKGSATQQDEIEERKRGGRL